MRHLLLFVGFFFTASTLLAQADSVLHIGIKVEPPFVIQDEDGELSGLSIDLWEAIAREQGVDYRYTFFNDHLGLIRALDFKEIDLSINPIHVNELRLKMLSATQPYYVSTIGIADRQRSSSTAWRFIRNFFSYNFLRVILLLFLLIFTFGTLIWLAERKQNHRQFRPGLIGVFDGLWCAAVTMTTVGYGDKSPKSTAGKIVALVWMFTGVVVVSGFTATVASSLTVNTLTSEYATIADLRKANRIGTVYGSSSEDFLSNNRIRQHLGYDDADAALDALAREEIDLLLYDKTVLRYLMDKKQLGRRATLLPVDFDAQYRSFFLTKNSPDLHWINPLLVRQINQSSWQDLLLKYGLKME